MQSRNRFTCFIIGEGTLPIQCGEILLNRGHEICGIISPDDSVNHWARGKNIPHAEPSDDLTTFIRRRPFDYVFSIVNIVNYYSLLKECLELPRKGAINYHDALLPRYAGFYTTSWALMHRERAHGVTWHLMTRLIDAGDVLKQYPIEIVDEDTAFTLNAKCYDAAISSFPDLVEDLSCGRACARKQDLDKRIYFPLYKRPPAGCVISWNKCARDIDAFVRALDFGPYPNLLGLPKLALGKDFLIVPKIDVLDSTSEKPPGTVTTIDHGCLKISTADREIALRKVLTIDGQLLTISDLSARLELREGDRFRNLDEEIARRVSTRYASVCKHEDFWVKRLATLVPIILPYGAHTASDLKPAQYATVPIPIPEEVITFLEDRHADWSKGDFLLAAFAAYLTRIGGVYRFDIGFSDVELQRNLAGLEGFFASHVPLRVNVDDAQSFVELFHAVREEAKLVGRHDTYARDVVARYPLLRSAPELRRRYTLPVVVEQTEKLDDYEAVLGSEFALVIAEDRAECRWVYDAEVLDENNIVRMAGQFALLLQGIAVDPDRRIAEIPLLTAKERHHLLVEFNNTQTDYPHDRCLHQLFEAQVERTPDAIAIICEGEQLTYRELNQRANQLAHYLRKLGVGPDTLVAICMERSIELIVGLLGILKAGGAYVPLDPAYPKERLTFMLEDSQARILLTQDRIIENLPNQTARVVCLDADWQEIAQQSPENPHSETSAENLAYVIYTSGSTGKPKGVMVEHRSLVNYLYWFNEAPIGKRSRNLPAISKPTFDLSLKQLLAPLLSGSQVWMISEEVASDPLKLLQSLSSHATVSLNCVPSFWNIVLEALDSSSITARSVRLSSLLLGGEVSSKPLLDKTFAQFPDIEIWNLYGPTEATVNATFARIDRTGSCPIGRPLANVQIYILDGYFNPVPIGVAGELYIGGAGLARGYLNRPELTAEKFIANPFSDEPGSRLYRTGDLGRYLPDGNIEFLGRIDHQVKIRGFRIELGEIEAVLIEHPGVQQTIVVACEDSPGQKQLVAYIVPNREQSSTATEWRSFLKQKLPDYMVPSAFVKMDSLPLTPNGKADRRALPLPDQRRPELDDGYVAPSGPVEEVLARICAEVLKLDRVGIHDNFFELGGHSLRAIQVMSRIRDAFRVELPLRSLFETPSVAGLAELLEAMPWAAKQSQRFDSNVTTGREQGEI